MRNDTPHCELDAELRVTLAPVERPLLCEVSVKAVGGALTTGRYIVSFPRAALGPGPQRKLRQMLADLGAPPEGVARLDQMQSRSRSVHFGYEPDRGGALIKCYLEFAPDRQPLPNLTFLALKWRQDGTFAETLYIDRDALDAGAQDGLLCDVVPQGGVRDAMLSLADFTRGHTALRFLEVTEPGSPRRSIDLNLAESGETVGARLQELSALLGGGREVAAYLGTHTYDRLGHVAAGTTRDGAAFGALYHGAHRMMSVS